MIGIRNDLLVIFYYIIDLHQLEEIIPKFLNTIWPIQHNQPPSDFIIYVIFFLYTEVF